MGRFFNHLLPFSWWIFFSLDLAKENVQELNHLISTWFKNVSWYCVWSRCFTIFLSTNIPLNLFFSDRFYDLVWMIISNDFIYCCLLVREFFFQMFLKALVLFENYVFILLLLCLLHWRNLFLFILFYYVFNSAFSQVAEYWICESL